MALASRVIPCLDVAAGRVVKGVNFANLRDMGDPVELAAAYFAQGADELTFLDVTATVDARATTYDASGAPRRRSSSRSRWAGECAPPTTSRACSPSGPTRSG